MLWVWIWGATRRDRWRPLFWGHNIQLRPRPARAAPERVLALFSPCFHNNPGRRHVKSYLSDVSPESPRSKEPEGMWRTGLGPPRA